jgi:hypothetical protein
MENPQDPAFFRDKGRDKNPYPRGKSAGPCAFYESRGQDAPIPMHPVPDDEGKQMVMMGIA